jgi:sugar phosphate isomerase/epimerase
MRIGICSFSFHRLLAEGKQDMFQYMKDCVELGCTQLDPWCAHLAPLHDGDNIIHAGHNPGEAKLDAAEDVYIEKVKAAADELNMPFGCLAVDGACIYADTPADIRKQRALQYRWLDIAGKLNCEFARIDAGGPEDMPDDAFAIIKEGYEDIIAYGRERGVRIITENHFGPSKHPENVVKLIEEIDGLGYLFDTNNWAEGKQREGWDRCAQYADVTHIKTFEFDADGNVVGVDMPYAFELLKKHGFDGCWGIESVPRDGDEMAGARATVALIKRLAAE